MAGRPVAWVAAIVLLVEAVGAGLLNWFLGLVVDEQRMSLAGLDPDVMKVSSWAAGVLAALYLLLCAALLIRIAIRNLPPGRVARLLLISVAVVHGVLGAFCVGIVGWGAFAAMVVVLGLVVLVLVAYPPAAREPRGPREAEPGPGEPPAAAPAG
ncbi:hypothetical protein [Streptomyces sp. NPDC050560]|uniref:hypothetical protein n=1 Tax=Streptomyces sp. NPDC050560 TaxID=3365630 RepID=UPI0037A6ACA8